MSWPPVEGMLAPGPTDEHAAAFWRFGAAGELRVQRCSGCGRRRFPPRPLCPSCHSFDHEWERLSGRGRIWSFVVSHPPLLPAYGEQAPYAVVVVELEAGDKPDDPALRLVGNLCHQPGDRLDVVDPASVAIGDQVEVVFDPIDDDTALPRWRRVEG